MKIMKLINISLEPVEVKLFRPFQDIASIFWVESGKTLDVTGNIQYTVASERLKDVRIDTTYE